MKTPIKQIPLTETPAFMTRDPYFIPGYSGYCPQYKFRGVGGTYGHFTNEILTNPPWKSARSVLNKIKPEDIPPRPTAAAKEELRRYSRTTREPLIYSSNMKTGYAGAIPHSDDFQGQSFPNNSLQAVASFNKQQRNRRQLLRDVDIKVGVQDGSIPMKNLPKCIETTPMAQRYGAPMPHTYFNAAKYKPHRTPNFSKSPYDMENGDPNKYIKSGHTGHVPLIGERCGHTRTKLTQDALCEFGEGRLYYKSPKMEEKITQYDANKLPPYVHPPPPPRPRSPQAPIIVTIDPKSDPGTEFPVPLGLPTTYRGHVQGLKDVVGMTYGTATRYLNKLRCPNVLGQKVGERNQNRCYNKR